MGAIEVLLPTSVHESSADDRAVVFGHCITIPKHAGIVLFVVACVESNVRGFDHCLGNMTESCFVFVSNCELVERISNGVNVCFYCEMLGKSQERCK